MQPFLQPIDALLPGGRLSSDLGPVVGEKRPKVAVQNDFQFATASKKRRRLDDTAPAKPTRPPLTSSLAPLDASMEKKMVQGKMRPRLTSVPAPVPQFSMNPSAKKLSQKTDGLPNCNVGASDVTRDVDVVNDSARKRKRGVADDVHSQTEKRRRSETTAGQSSIERKGVALMSARDKKEDGRIVKTESRGVEETSVHVLKNHKKAAEGRRKVSKKAGVVSEGPKDISEGKSIPAKRNGILTKVVGTREPRGEVSARRSGVRETHAVDPDHSTSIYEKHKDNSQKWRNIELEPKDGRKQPKDDTNLPVPGREGDLSSTSSKIQMNEREPPKRFSVRLKSKPIPESRPLSQARSDSIRSKFERPKHKQDQDQDCDRAHSRSHNQDRDHDKNRGRGQRRKSDLCGERGQNQNRHQDGDRDRGHHKYSREYDRDSTRNRGADRDRDYNRDRDTRRGRNRDHGEDDDKVRGSYRDSVRGDNLERDGDWGQDRGRCDRDWERLGDARERERKHTRMDSARRKDQESGSRRSRSGTNGESAGGRHGKEWDTYKAGEGNREGRGPGRGANRERSNKIQIPTSVPSSGPGSSSSRGSHKETERILGAENSELASEARVQRREDLAGVRAKLTEYESLWAEAKSKCEAHLEKKEYDAYEEATKKAFRLYFDWSIAKETELRMLERLMPLAERLAKKRDIINHYRYLTRTFASQHVKELETLKRKKAIVYLTRGINKAYLRMFGLHRLWQRGQRTREGDATKFISDVVKARNEGAIDKIGIEEMPTDKLVALKEMANDYCNIVQIFESVVFDDGEGPEEAGKECVLQ